MERFCIPSPFDPKTKTKKSITFLAMFSIQQWNLELVVANLVYFVMIITEVLFWTFVWCFAISSAAFPDLWHYITLLFTALAIIITFLFTFYPKSILISVFSKIIIACPFTFFLRYIHAELQNDCCKPFTFFAKCILLTGVAADLLLWMHISYPLSWVPSSLLSLLSL